MVGRNRGEFIRPHMAPHMWGGKHLLNVVVFLDMSLLFGFHMPLFTFADAKGPALFDRVIEQARAAEAAGFDLVTVMDHFYQIGGVGPETDPMLEAYTTLAAIARETTKVKLSTLVTGVIYRNPAVLAKQVTTLDVVSNGRAMLGIGAEWNESESTDTASNFRRSRSEWSGWKRR